jgi:hypothetical protein
MQVLITAVPPGEAPEEIRQAWVGLVLPVAEGESGPTELPGFGVLSGRPEPFNCLWRRFLGRTTTAIGYAVPADTAVAILERASPKAAAWWFENTPHLLGVGICLGFAAEVCKEVP